MYFHISIPKTAKIKSPKITELSKISTGRGVGVSDKNYVTLPSDEKGICRSSLWASPKIP